MSSPDYVIKVPVEIRESDQEKLNNSESEIERLIEAIKALNTM